MNFLQDLVHLHSKKTNEELSAGLVYDPNYRPSTYLEVALIGFGALVILGVAAVLSIPDKQRQEARINTDMGREFFVEPCDINSTRAEIGPRFDSVDPVLRTCVY